MYKWLSKYFFTSDDPIVRACLSEALETVLNKTQEPNKSKKVQHSNAKNAVLFESINLILHFQGWELYDIHGIHYSHIIRCILHTLCISPWKKVWCKYPVASRFPTKSTSQPLHILHVKPILVVYTFLYFVRGGGAWVGEWHLSSLPSLNDVYMWPAMEKSTTRARVWFYSRGFNTRHNFFFPIFFSCHFMKVWSFLCSFIRFHYNTMLFNYCNDREKEGTLVLASYVHGLTVIIDQ